MYIQIFNNNIFDVINAILLLGKLKRKLKTQHFQFANIAFCNHFNVQSYRK